MYVVCQAGERRDWEVLARIPHAGGHHTIYTHTVREILGVVPSFAIGVARALSDNAAVIAAFHDDLLIEQDGWDEDVVRLFKACPRAGLVGFGGAKGLGSDDLYKSPYHPMQLARQGFLSNMRDAEAHGMRSEAAVPVACLDGFSQIGLREFWRGVPYNLEVGLPPSMEDVPVWNNLFTLMKRWGVIHHFYDGMLGCFARRLGYLVWLLPIKCHHYGGRTAVADARYLEWANAQHPPDGTSGDQMFWTQAHQIGYTEFQDVLPIRT